MIRPALLFLLLSLTPGLAMATPEEDKTRDEAMFGEEAAADEEEKPAKSSDNPLDEPVRSAGAIRDLLQDADDPLTIGGTLSLRFQYTWADEFTDDEHILNSPNVVYLFLDARPSERLRAFVRGRLGYDPTLQDGLSATGLPADALTVTLDQLWLKADIARVVYITIGRQPIRWGSNRFWNPTDVLNQQRRDPLAFYDERVGPTLLKLHFPVESLGWNFYALAGMDDVKHPDQIIGALRGEFLVGPIEASLSASYGKERPLRLGVDLSAGIWLLDLRMEASFAYDDERPRYLGQFDLATFDITKDKTPTEQDLSDRWRAQLAAGAEIQIMYTDQDYMLIGVEYFSNPHGYDDADLYDWLLVQSAGGESAFTPFYLGQHYLAAYIMFPSPGTWDDTNIALSGLGNLSDLTGLIRLNWQVRVLTYLDLAFFAAARLGDRGEFHYGVTVPAGIPGVPDDYKDGFSIYAPRLEFGVWATLAL